MSWSQADFRSLDLSVRSRYCRRATRRRKPHSYLQCTPPPAAFPSPFMALIAIYKQSEAALLMLATLAGFIQLLDAGVGLLQHDPGKVIGPLVTAAFQLFAMYLLSSARSSVD